MLGRWLKFRAPYTDELSPALALRRRRFEFFLSLVARLPGELRVLDVGGTAQFWETMAGVPWERLGLTLVNRAPKLVPGDRARNVAGDAGALPFADRSFDVVFSNSVLEHVGDFAAQGRMAGECRRVGRRLFIQTPNRYFPLEPHYFCPFFQFLGPSSRAWLLTNFRLGRIRRRRFDRFSEARLRATAINLLDEGQLRRLFPGAAIHRERFLGLTKSLVAYQGFPE